MDIRLNDVEVRVLGCLLEKSMTTPDNYPLSLNALTNACNQKSNREPVVAFDEETVVRALVSLKEKRLVVQGDSSRVPKYSEIFVSAHNLISKEAAVLMVLMVRGPQTLGEIRSRTERAFAFATTEEVEDVLADLAELGFVVKLPRQPGRKESRYTHLFAGEPEIVEESYARPEPATLVVQAENEKIATLVSEIQELRNELADLKDDFKRFRSEFE